MLSILHCYAEDYGQHAAPGMRSVLQYGCYLYYTGMKKIMASMQRQAHSSTSAYRVVNIVTLCSMHSIQKSAYSVVDIGSIRGHWVSRMISWYAEDYGQHAAPGTFFNASI